MTRKDLETAAIDHHHRGRSWCDFWNRHRREIVLCEPWDRGRFHRLVAG